VEARDVVVIGGSAGSLQPLLELARAPSADLPGSVAVTIHVGEHAAPMRRGPVASQTNGDGQLAAGSNDYRGDMRAGNLAVDRRIADLYAQAEAARRRSTLLSVQLRESQRRAMENWQLIQAAWQRTHQIQKVRQAARTDEDRRRYSAYARVQAKLATLPVIEQAKGIIMAQCGWSEDRAFDALRQASQRENVKVRDLATRIVAKTASSGGLQKSQRASA
jgi:ANTAR domain